MAAEEDLAASCHDKREADGTLLLLRLLPLLVLVVVSALLPSRSRAAIKASNI